jgi:hypothetical protein
MWQWGAFRQGTQERLRNVFCRDPQGWKTKAARRDEQGMRASASVSISISAEGRENDKAKMHERNTADPENKGQGAVLPRIWRLHRLRGEAMARRCRYVRYEAYQ